MSRNKFTHQKIGLIKNLVIAEKLVSTKKKDVDSIRENFNIQIDNPVCFLNQETSKHFLNSSNIRDKYQFFMKASQIDSIKRLQEEVDNQRQSSLRQIEDKEAQLPQLEEGLFKLEAKYKKVSYSLDWLLHRKWL